MSKHTKSIRLTIALLASMLPIPTLYSSNNWDWLTKSANWVKKTTQPAADWTAKTTKSATDLASKTAQDEIELAKKASVAATQLTDKAAKASTDLITKATKDTTDLASKTAQAAIELAKKANTAASQWTEKAISASEKWVNQALEDTKKLTLDTLNKIKPPFELESLTIRIGTAKAFLKGSIIFAEGKRHPFSIEIESQKIISLLKDSPANVLFDHIFQSIAKHPTIAPLIPNVSLPL